MLDIKYIIENKETVLNAYQKRNASIDLDALIALNDKRKAIQLQFDELRSKQKQKSKEIGLLKREGKDASEVMQAVQALTDQVKELEAEQTQLQNDLNEQLLQMPNLPHESVVAGKDESANQLLHDWGTKPEFDFKPKEHFEIGENLGLLDFEKAAQIAGSRFSILRGPLAKLEWALAQFMMAEQQAKGYELVIPPYLVNADALTGTGQLPKFEDDLFKTGEGYYLIPTAEVPVTNLYRQETVKESDLPHRFCALTPCFRSEAGSYGKDMKGLIRQHQFHKVELVKIAHPDQSYNELEGMREDAEAILQKLGLPYRVMALCGGDMGFGATKTYDLEVWLPGQNAYREISSVSNCEDFQARRMQTRFKDSNGKMQFVHTLNGSGLAVGRTLIAVLENYQQKDGSILIPEALQPFFGSKVISA